MVWNCFCFSANPILKWWHLFWNQCWTDLSFVCPVLFLYHERNLCVKVSEGEAILIQLLPVESHFVYSLGQKSLPFDLFWKAAVHSDFFWIYQNTAMSVANKLELKVRVSILQQLWHIFKSWMLPAFRLTIGKIYWEELSQYAMRKVNNLTK